MPKRPSPLSLPNAAPWSVAVAILVCIAIYWPGLRGGYVFDDFGNIVNNPAFAPAALHAHFWHAVFSGNAGPLDRPLSMLSFATQLRMWGMDPWPLKLANVLLHAFNGWLVWLLCTRVVTWLYAGMARPALIPPQWLAAFVTIAWLLAPIQLTAVLYVVQREESLATTFVLLGLLAYWHGRMRLIDGRSRAMLWIWFSLIIGTTAAALAKETGVLLPAYALVLEAIVLRGRTGTTRVGNPDTARWISHPLAPVFTTLLFLPGALGLAWILPGILNGGAYASRTFTLGERLLTEGRVMVEYLHWIVLPGANSLSLFHDDYRLSTGWFTPWTTAASWLLLVALLIAALAWRRKNPLFSLGVLWFAVGQSLVSTIVPLELVYEHRNYLPSFGIFLAFFGLVFAWAPPDAERRYSVRVLAVSLSVGLIALYTLLTGIRANVWGNPYRLAYFEATTHPESPRANYALARIDLVMSGFDETSPSYQLGMRQMEIAAKLPDSGLQPIGAMMFAMLKAGQHIPTKVWTLAESTAARTKPSTQDVQSIRAIVQGAIDGSFHLTPADQRQIGQLLQRMLQKSPDLGGLLSVAANYAMNVQRDYALGYQLILRNVVVAPSNYLAWKNLVVAQTALGLFNPAEHSIERMRELDRFGTHRAEIARLAHELRQRMTSSAPHSGQPTGGDA